MGRFFEDEFDLVDLEFAVFEMFDTFIRVGRDGPADRAEPADRTDRAGRDEPPIRSIRLNMLCLVGSWPAGGEPLM